MELELFKNTYTPYMMKIVRQFEQMESASLATIINSGTHHQLLKIIPQIETLAKARMLLQEYPGCEICMEINCQSDHK